MAKATKKNPEPFRPKEWEERQQIVLGHASQLAEHFDSVIIICSSRTTGARTSMNYCGKGNAYAVDGSVREWMKVQDERTRQTVRNEEIEDDE